MNNSIRGCAARAAGRWMLGIAFLLPLVAGAAAPTVSFSSIVATPQTNYNGSAVTATFTGSLVGYDVALKVGNTSYVGAVSDDTVTFFVPGDVAIANNIYASTITATKDSVTYTIGGKYLYQGAPIAGGGGTNAWFKTWAKGTEVENENGAWKVGNVSKDPPAAESKILIGENDDGEYEDFVFMPTAANPTGQSAVVDMTLSFDAAMDGEVDAAGQAAIRVVTVGNIYRFAAVTNGVWTTNTTITATPGSSYSLRVTMGYRTVPATVKYEVKDGDIYKTIVSSVSATMKPALESVTFNGTGKLAVMIASNIVDSVDASLVKDGDEKHYADIDTATAAGKTDLTLLWNTAWTPVATVDGAWTIHGDSYQLYINPTGEGVWVRNSAGTWTVRANYYEAANLYFNNNGSVTTNKYTYFTNAVAQTGAAITNLYLLQDVALDTKLAVNKTMTFNGEDRILSGSGLNVASGKTFTIAGGCIGILQKNCAGTVVLKGGRYKTEPGWAAPTEPYVYTFADLATPVRDVYVKQLMLASKAPDPVTEKLLPMTDANGESVSVVVNTSWVDTKVPGTAAKQSEELSTVQDNGMTRFDNEVLGLTTSGGAVEANNIPVITPVQSSTADKVTFSLGNVNKDTISASGAKVTYRVVTSSKPGGKDGAVSSYVAPSAEVQMPLPSSGVQYYIIEVDTGAVK